ncbi:hypothetical protein RJ641_031397 [Dillenia turbinata]|uniref:DUF8040 domain-containing protein n=1 Tax=Dillenia turbinata TaxID=194707 RepID=A0AAN8ZEK4_9MAGN
MYQIKFKSNEQDNRYKKFRNKDLSLFWYRYDAIFSDIVAIGHRARALGQTYTTNQSLKNGSDLLLDDINEGKKGYEVEDHDIEGTDKSDDSQSDVQNIKGLDNTFIGNERLFPPTFNAKEKESASNETRCCQAFRMTKIVFIDFYQDLQHNYGLNPIRGMSIYEEVGIFLMICAHGVGNCPILEMFNHSGETIHRHFYRVLGVNYIGAIDGTHIKARLPRGEEIPYIGCKSYPMQNVLAIVDFNMQDRKERCMTIESSEKLYGKIFAITMKIFAVQEQDNCVNLVGSKKSLIFYIYLI